MLRISARQIDARLKPCEVRRDAASTEEPSRDAAQAPDPIKAERWK